MTKRINI